MTIDELDRRYESQSAAAVAAREARNVAMREAMHNAQDESRWRELTAKWADAAANAARVEVLATVAYWDWQEATRQEGESHEPIR